MATRATGPAGDPRSRGAARAALGNTGTAPQAASVPLGVIGRARRASDRAEALRLIERHMPHAAPVAFARARHAAMTRGDDQFLAVCVLANAGTEAHALAALVSR